MLEARSGQAEPARIASGEAADRPPTQISCFGHECKNVAHGDSRGEKAGPMLLEKPREGRQSRLDNRRSSVATTWLSVLSLCRHPTAGAVGHILAPLMRLGVGWRCYSSAYALGRGLRLLI